MVGAKLSTTVINELLVLTLLLTSVTVKTTGTPVGQMYVLNGISLA